MVKKVLIPLIAIVALLHFAAPSVLGFSVWKLGSAVEVSTGMSAKLACSAKYITGLSDNRIVDDLASYSPAVKVVDISYNEQAKSATASLFGMATTTAQFRQGLGCSLTMGNSDKLDQVIVPKLATSNAPWPLGNNTAENINDDIQAVLNGIVKSDNANGLNSRALLVVHDGKIVAQHYGDGFDENTPLLGWSMGKSVTAMMIARLQQMGKTSIAQSQLFDSWTRDDRANINLTHLLQMSSGLHFDETYAPGSDATDMLFTAESASNVAMKSKVVFSPSQHFSYSSGTTNLLTRYMHDSLGGSTQADVDFLFNALFIPLGMQNSIFETDSSGVFVGSSYIYASGQDWARLGLLMLNEGRWTTKTSQVQLLPAKWVKDAAQPNSSDNDTRYGYQFWLNNGKVDGKTELRWPALPVDSYAMMGNRKQSVMIIPSKNTLLIRLGWTKGEYPLEQNYHQLLTAIEQSEG